MFEDFEMQKQIILSSSMNDNIKRMMIRNVDWSMLSVALNDSVENRKKFNNILSKAIHKYRPDYIRYISQEDVEKEISIYMEKYYGTGYKIVYIVDSGDEDINDIPLFYIE